MSAGGVNRKSYFEAAKLAFGPGLRENASEPRTLRIAFSIALKP